VSSWRDCRRSRRVSLAGIIAASILTPVATALTGAARPFVVIEANPGLGPSPNSPVRYAAAPSRIVLTGASGYSSCRWRRWGSPTAVGMCNLFGSTCKPDCAAGAFVVEGVLVQATSRVKCRGVLYYTRLTGDGTATRLLTPCAGMRAGLDRAVSGVATASGVSLPRVYLEYPNGAFTRQCETYTIGGRVTHHCYGPSPLGVRPSTISRSVDGDGDLSGLVWSSWTSYNAVGSGLELIRCFGGSTDPHCGSGRFGYSVPVAVGLSHPVSTSRGVVFTVVTVRRVGFPPSITCLPPASAC
jgi:hypothetical protein